MKERDYNQIDALRYLVQARPTYANEYADSDMYHILSKVILENSKRYTKQELDKLIQEVPNN